MWRSSPFYLKAGREELWTARKRSSVRRAVHGTGRRARRRGSPADGRGCRVVNVKVYIRWTLARERPTAKISQ